LACDEAETAVAAAADRDVEARGLEQRGRGLDDSRVVVQEEDARAVTAVRRRESARVILAAATGAGAEVKKRNSLLIKRLIDVGVPLLQ